MEFILIRILLIVLSLSVPVIASEQYSENACILIKQQLNDYDKRLGRSAQLYINTRDNYETHCQNPKPSNLKENTLISTVQPIVKSNSKNPEKVTNPKLKSTPLLKPPQTSNIAPPFELIRLVLKALMPIVILCVLIILIRYYLAKKHLASLSENIKIGFNHWQKSSSRYGAASKSVSKGLVGEMMVNQALYEQLDKTKYHLHANITLPLEDGGTTQLDHVVVSEYGLFIIETKNLSGWIFGTEKEKEWRQVITKNQIRKFQNPLRQNYLHIRTVAKLLDISHSYVHSVVIFTSKAELKNRMPKNVGHISEMVSYIKSFEQPILKEITITEISKILERIKLTSSQETDEQHKEYLRDKFKQ